MVRFALAWNRQCRNPAAPPAPQQEEPTPSSLARASEDGEPDAWKFAHNHNRGRKTTTSPSQARISKSETQKVVYELLSCTYPCVPLSIFSSPSFKKQKLHFFDFSHLHSKWLESPSSTTACSPSSTLSEKASVKCWSDHHQRSSSSSCKQCKSTATLVNLRSSMTTELARSSFNFLAESTSALASPHDTTSHWARSRTLSLKSSQLVRSVTSFSPPQQVSWTTRRHEGSTSPERFSASSTKHATPPKNICSSTPFVIEQT
ncbi:unnamed protein product [Sympodiomycopsis kandeliae]